MSVDQTVTKPARDLATSGDSPLAPAHFDLPWGRLAGLAARHQGARRILCLHGWMDNAASFAPLAEQLCKEGRPDLVALDYAGHGQSDHRPLASRYYFSDYLFDIDATLDAIGWDRCVVIGHSMGAALGAALAAAAPERVEALVMLDAMGLVTEPPEKAAERLRNAMRATRKPREHRRRFERIEDAAAIRQANMPMGDDAALRLAKRALVATDSGWRWRTDPRAMWPSPVFMTEPQSDSILAAIECPVLAAYTPVLESWLGADRVRARLDRLRAVDTVRLAGGHHVHMDDPEPVAQAIVSFLDKNADPEGSPP